MTPHDKCPFNISYAVKASRMRKVCPCLGAKNKKKSPEVAFMKAAQKWSTVVLFSGHLLTMNSVPTGYCLPYKGLPKYQTRLQMLQSRRPQLNEENCLLFRNRTLNTNT